MLLYGILFKDLDPVRSIKGKEISIYYRWNCPSNWRSSLLVMDLYSINS